MIDLNKLVDSGKYDGPFSDMKPFITLLAGLTIALDAKLVLEIGTGFLFSTKAFLWGLEKTKGQIITCDPVKRWEELSRLKRWAYFSHPQFQFIQKTSQEVAKTWNKQIDILFIDGSHEYESVLFDYKTFSPFVRKGGLIIFHDTNPPTKTAKGAGKVCQGIKEMEKLIFGKTPGLTVFQKTEAHK